MLGSRSSMTALHPPLSLSQAVEQFLAYLSDYRRSPASTLRAYRGDLKLAMRFLGASRDPRQIGKTELLDFAKSLNGASPATVRRRLACLSSLFAHLVDAGHLAANPALRIPLPRLSHRVPKVLGSAEVDALLTGCETDLEKLLIALLLTTGIRRAEAAAIKVEDINLEDGLLLVHGKGDRERVLPLASSEVAALRDHLRTRTKVSAYLFPGRNGQPLDPIGIYRKVLRVARRAGFPQGRVWPHLLRHTAATLFLQASDLRATQEWLGHVSPVTTVRYTHPDAAAARGAAEKLSKSLTRTK